MRLKSSVKMRGKEAISGKAFRSSYRVAHTQWGRRHRMEAGHTPYYHAALKKPPYSLPATFGKISGFEVFLTD